MKKIILAAALFLLALPASAMQIALVVAHRGDAPEVATLAAALTAAGVPYVKLAEKPLGAISSVPCIAAIDDSGLAKHEWLAGKAIDKAELQAWAAMSGKPAALPPVPLSLGLSDATAYLDGLVASSSITKADRDAIIAAWPTSN